MTRTKKPAIVLPLLLALAACGQEAPVTVPSAAPSSPGPPSSVPSSPPSSVPPAPSESASVSSVAANSDETTIRAGGEIRDSVYKFDKPDRVSALYAEDAVLMPPTAPTATGPTAIRRYFESDKAQFSAFGYTQFVPANTVEVRVSGNLGYRWGRYSVKDKSGATVDTGKWLEVWQKADGKWQIIRDLWNSDTLPLLMPADQEGGKAE